MAEQMTQEERTAQREALRAQRIEEREARQAAHDALSPAEKKAARDSALTAQRERLANNIAVTQERIDAIDAELNS